MKSARNHPQEGRVPAGKHNIGHHGKQLWRWMAGSGGGGGAGVGGGAWGALSLRAHRTGLAALHHLLLLYTATCGPPVPQARNPPVPPRISVTHAQISVFPTRRIFVSPIYLYFSYICPGQISVTAQCFYLSHICFSESVSFPCFVSRSLARQYILSDFISAKLFSTLPPLICLGKLQQDQMG